MRKGFTLIEMIFVIVIFGILSKFGVELLYKIYENYVSSNVQNRLQGQTELAIEQIANRLVYRIKDTTIARDGSDNIVTIGKIGTVNATAIEWIGMDIDGWRAGSAPTWSGLIDLNNAATTSTSLVSPGSTGAGAGAIFFIGSNVNSDTSTSWANLMHPVTATGNTLTGSFTGQDVYEYYQFAKSAYRISLEGQELVLYHTYTPWNSTARGTRSLIMENVKTFMFGYSGDTLLIKLCVTDNDSMGTGEYSICKEKVVF